MTQLKWVAAGPTAHNELRVHAAEMRLPLPPLRLRLRHICHARGGTYVLPVATVAAAASVCVSSLTPAM
jgi:hypothetical protein